MNRSQKQQEQLMLAYDLPDRQREVLAGVALGLRDKEIAVVLGLSRGTVKNHLYWARRRLGIGTTRVEIAKILYPVLRA